MSALLIKLSGGMLILLSSILISKACCLKLWKRVYFFDGLITGFTRLEELVCTYLMPIDEALVKASEDADTASFVFSRASSAKGDITAKFSQALYQSPGASKCIIPMVQGLISPDEHISRNSFSGINKRLSAERECISKEVRSLSRLYTAAGPLIGAAVIIILI